MIGRFLKWLGGILAEHTVLRLIATPAMAYLAGVVAQLQQGARDVLDAVPPLFWPVLSVLVIAVVFHATVVYPVIKRRREYKMAYFKQVESTFGFLAGTYKPETLNPERPGNPAAMKEQTQAHVDLLRARMMKHRRSNIPPGIDVSSTDSLREWYEFMRAERAKVYL